LGDHARACCHGGRAARNLGVFAALLGSWFLKEAFTFRRAAGTAVIVAGVMALRMG
jgi:drug/metabolite transporter (DMT)-like permease